jgi:multiple RNA-binding domain-containing protein 1
VIEKAKKSKFKEEKE